MLKRIGILLSGRGSNFEAIAAHIADGSLDCEIGFVFSNRAQAPGLDRARRLGLACGTLDAKGLDRDTYDRQVAALLDEQRLDLICLAGYMRLLSGYFVSHFAGRILNIHPSLLPAFPGLDAQHQAWSHGVKQTGCTVHFVDENLDSGPIVLQQAVAVLDDDTADTLAARILAEEHRLYSQAIAWVLRGSYRIEGRRVLKTSP